MKAQEVKTLSQKLIPARGLKHRILCPVVSGYKAGLSQKLIPARGLKRWLPKERGGTHEPEPFPKANPRKGTETLWLLSRDKPVNPAFPKANPRKGTET